jgi:predicted nucleotide-binding protein (sugar kinase/HSP70/actin superfamily)
MSVRLPESRPFKVSFPHMGNYSIPVKTLAEHLECEIVVPPRMTRRTLELGARHSPEFVCIPFKYNLGNYIEALDAGANLLLQAGGGCRFGYYGEVQEAILRDLGYDFGMVRLIGGWKLRDHMRDFKQVNPRLNMLRALKAYQIALRQTQALDTVEDYMRRNAGFEVEDGAFEQVHEAFLGELDTARDKRTIAEIEQRYLGELAAIPTERPDDLLRIGIVGELYVLMEPFSNLFVEKELAKRGVEVHRFVTVSNMVAHGGRRGSAHLDDLIERSGDYVRYHLGADGTESVSMTYQLMQQGFDGVLHLKPFGCMPEVNAMASLQRLSREHTFPVLFISYDAQTSETGLKTRLDAFCDMLRMSKQRPGTVEMANGAESLATEAERSTA